MMTSRVKPSVVLAVTRLSKARSARRRCKMCTTGLGVRRLRKPFLGGHLHLLRNLRRHASQLDVAVLCHDKDIRVMSRAGKKDVI